MTVIIILAALALLLAVIEIFITPGFGLAGISSIVCALVCVVFIYNDYGLGWAVAAVAAALVVFGVVLGVLTRCKTLDKVSLHTSIDSTNATVAQLSVKLGDTGKALTRLALIGNAEINGKNVEVKSSGAFVNPGTPVRVVSVSEALIIVEPIAAG